MSEQPSMTGWLPTGGRHDLVVVDGRSFAISAESGDMVAATHGLVYDDLRHVRQLRLRVNGGDAELLGASTPTPLSAVIVSRVMTPVATGGGDDERGPSEAAERRELAEILVIRRRWIAGSLVEELTLRNPLPQPVTLHVELSVSADFAHVFDVKSGAAHGGDGRVDVGPGGTWTLRSAHHAQDSTRVVMDPPPEESDPDRGIAGWHVHVPGRGETTIAVSAQPVSAGVPATLERPTSARGTAIRELSTWRVGLPSVVSLDPRLPAAVDQSLADLAALRIVDRAHPDRAVVAAGAPWFMTLFGRDSLLTAWMTLPFDGSLAAGVLASLAELQGRVDDPASEEQPGRIVHELRRHGGSGPFSSRSRYYGTVDATPLFVCLAAEAWRWRAVDETALRALAPALGRAVDWVLGPGDSDGDGFLDYRRRDAHGLSNQGWKDSWDGITRADGTLPEAPLALVEVQGYAYAALRGAAALSDVVDLGHDATDLLERAERLKDRFNETFWDRRGFFVLGLDGDGRTVDSLTTNPGHALWSGIADEDKARRYAERLTDPDLWTGWGLRTLASSMAAYDPLSYHNGSVWPHDTALCIAGAARYGQWDTVDVLVDGALEATRHFAGRPPELFAGLARDDVAIPVAYPSSCSPQAWASASVLLLVRALLGLEPTADGSTVELVRPDLSGVPDLALEGLRFAGRPLSVHVDGGRGRVDLGPAEGPSS